MRANVNDKDDVDRENHQRDTHKSVVFLAPRITLMFWHVSLRNRVALVAYAYNLRFKHEWNYNIFMVLVHCLF